MIESIYLDVTMSADNSSDHKKLELFSNEENEDMDTEDEPATLSHSVRHCAGKRDCHLVVSETNDSGGDEGESSIHSSYTQLSPSLSVRVMPHCANRARASTQVVLLVGRGTVTYASKRGKENNTPSSKKALPPDRKQSPSTLFQRGTL